MDAVPVVTLEGQLTSAMPLPPSRTTGVTTGSTTEGRPELLWNISSKNGAKPVPQLQEHVKELHRRTQFSQGPHPCCLETKMLDQNAGDIYTVPPDHACSPKGGAVKLGPTTDLHIQRSKHVYETGTTVIENATKDQGVSSVGSKDKHDPNGRHGIDLTGWPQEDKHFGLVSVNGCGHAVDTGAPCPVPALVVSSQLEPSCPPTVPLSPGSTPPTSAPLSGQRGTDLPRIVNHKPSSIAFADYGCPPGPHRGGRGSSNSSEPSSEEDKDDDNDDVFLETSRCGETLPGSRRRRGAGGGGTVGGGDVEEKSSSTTFAGSTDTTGYEAEEESNSKVESPLVPLSPWSQSMSQLMKWLDQLNLDIEEAISAGSSPSDTPCTCRRQPTSDRNTQQKAAAWATLGSQSLDSSGTTRGPDWEECHGLGVFSSNSSSVTRARPRKAEMSTKRRHGRTDLVTPPFPKG